MILQIKKKLLGLKIEEIGHSTKFYKRSPRKVTASDFIVAFCLLMNNGRFSLKSMAAKIFEITKNKVSHQAIAKKFQFRQIDFVNKVLQKAIEGSFQKSTGLEVRSFFQPFNRVLLEDSTCQKLSSSLNKSFSGSANQMKSKIGLATARIQFRVDIKRNVYSYFKLTNFRKNDVSHAEDILSDLSKDDLVIRDLGYWKSNIFQKIKESGAYFLSRLRLKVTIYNADNEEEINLEKFLKSKDIAKIDSIDMPILLSKDKIKVRMVAVKLPEAAAQKRRAVAKKNRNSKVNISKSAWYLMSWNIFITNVEVDVWKKEEIFKAYSLRWIIEMIFKGWKSKFNLAQFMKSCTGRNPARPEIIVVLFLVYLVLFYVSKFNEYQIEIYNKYKKMLSPLKFANFLKENFEFILTSGHKSILDILQYYCCYDKRHDRKNQLEILYAIKLS